MTNSRKIASISAVAMLGVTNLLAPLSYANAATGYDSLTEDDLKQPALRFIMPNRDAYLYAVVEPNTYTVDYNGNTHTSGYMSGKVFTYDSGDVLDLNAFGKTGYSFSGWTTEQDGSGSGFSNGATVLNLTAVDNAHVPIYAQWSANSYNIDYVLDDGSGTSRGVYSGVAPTSLAYDETGTIYNPTRTGYTFSGWYITGMDTESHIVGGEVSNESEEDGVKGTLFKNLRATSGTVHFAAKWDPKQVTYKVTHYLQELNGEYPASTELIDELSGTADKPVTGATHDYTGFTTPNEYSEIVQADGNTVFRYDYERKSYDLTLTAGRGVSEVSGTGEVTARESTSGSTIISFKYDEPVILSYALKQGYTGGQWSGSNGDSASSFNMPATGISKTAYAEPIVYHIIYHNYGGTGNGEDDTTYTIESPDITLSNLTRSNTTFLGWSGSNGSAAQKDVVLASGSMGDKEYFANWSCFTGYHTELTGTDNESCEADTDTQYRVNHIQQDLEGHYTIYIDSGYEYGETNTMTDVSANSYSGFELSGINNVIISGEGTSVVNAYYDRLSYNRTITITTGVDGITATASNPAEGGKIKYGDLVTLNADIADGYTFDSWTVTRDDDSSAVEVNGDTFRMPDSAVTIKANTTANVYDITIHKNGGTGGSNSQTYTKESEDITLIPPTRDNTTFVGWSGTDISGTTGSVTIAHGSTGHRTYEAIWSCNPGYHVDGDSCQANDYTVTVNYADDESHGSAETTIPFIYDETGTINNPAQSGYDFAGWTITGLSSGATIDGVPVTDSTVSGITGTEFNKLTTESGGTVTFTAVWTPRNDTKYVVHHYYENISGDAYELSGSFEYSGSVAEPVIFTGLLKNFSGFAYSGGYLTGDEHRPTTEPITQVNIDKYGTTEIFLYYTRGTYRVYLSGANVDTLTGGGNYKYGDTVTVNVKAKTGYHFVRWERRNENREPES